MTKISYKRHRFALEIIQKAIWRYFRFMRSCRDVEDLLAERGIDISYESIRAGSQRLHSGGIRAVVGCGAASRVNEMKRWLKLEGYMKSAQSETCHTILCLGSILKALRAMPPFGAHTPKGFDQAARLVGLIWYPRPAIEWMRLLGTAAITPTRPTVLAILLPSACYAVYPRFTVMQEMKDLK